MVDIGVAPHVVEAILNHVKRGVAGIYNRSSYEPERRAAMQAWADHVAPKPKRTGKSGPDPATV